jgi:hypothetical protein
MKHIQNNQKSIEKSINQPLEFKKISRKKSTNQKSQDFWQQFGISKKKTIH